MNSFTSSLWLALIALFPLAAQPALTAEPPTEASKIGKGSPADWKAAIQKNAAERQTIAAALMEVALDARVKNDDRNEAVVLLAEIPSKEVFDFLLKHFSLRIPKFYQIMSEDQARYQPCKYALSKMGWAAVPHMLSFLNQKRSDEELDSLSAVFRRILGPKGAIALLTVWQQSVDSPMRENLEKVLDWLKPDKK